MTDPHRIVASGYDRMADRYEAWAATIESPLAAWLEELLERLPPAAEVLELGCGGGTGASPELAARARLTGVDVSAEQVRRARRRLPAAQFLQADILSLELPQASFEAVVAIFVLNHVPRAELPRLLGRVGQWLRPGGLFLGTFGVSGTEGLQDDFLGVPMFFGSLTEDETLAAVLGAGLEPVRNEVVAQDEGEHGIARFLWVLARKPLRR